MIVVFCYLNALKRCVYVNILNEILHYEKCYSNLIFKRWVWKKSNQVFNKISVFAGVGFQMDKSRWVMRVAGKF